MCEIVSAVELYNIATMTTSDKELQTIANKHTKLLQKTKLLNDNERLPLTKR